MSPLTESEQTALVAQHLKQGIECHVAGRFDEAEKQYRLVLDAKPDHDHALHMMGLILYQKGQLDQAVTLIEQAIALNDQVALYHYNLGSILQNNGRSDEALQAYARVLSLNPAHVDTHLNKGHIYRERADWAAALEHYQKALRIKPEIARGQKSLAITLQNIGQYHNALRHLDMAQALDPSDYQIYLTRGIIFKERGAFEDALKQYAIALTYAPNAAEIHMNIGNATLGLGQANLAIEQYQHALHLKPEFAEAHMNLGNAYTSLSQFDQALNAYDQALRLNPDLAPAHLNQSVVLLAKGAFEQAWPKYEWRGWPKNHIPPATQWDGGDLGGRTLLIRREQGLGDTFQFIRYARLARARHARVVFKGQKSLFRLLKTMTDVDELIPEEAPDPPFDKQCRLMSLPYILGTTLNTIPTGIPYLFAEPALIALWRERLNTKPGFKVGLVWQSNPDNRAIGGLGRSFPLEIMAPLSQIKGVRLISLQQVNGTDQLTKVSFDIETMSDPVDQNGDSFIDTAAILMNLDLIITSDTATAHLAGALGRPTWVALKKVPDWRWLMDRSDSPWYPTLRLFRQKNADNWHEVFEEIARSLSDQVE